MNKVIVIGAGAAGCMAAVAAAAGGSKVAVYEKNERIGKKIFITGKGRCNVTNACEMPELFENVVSNEKFLYSALYGFTNRDVMEFFERAGCRLKEERGKRVFPVSDHASDIIKALEGEMKRLGVRLYTETAVKELLTEPLQGRVRGVLLQDGTKVRADAVIVATGGVSYPSTGSTGDGFRMAEKLGLTVTALRPALAPFVIREESCARLQGLSLKNVRAALLDGKREVYGGFGEMLFTHLGVSGPLILSASSYYGRVRSGECRLRLDLKPALSEEQLERRLLRDFEENRKKQFKNVADGLFPAKLTPVMVELSGIDPEKKAQEVTKEERKHFVRLIKQWELTVEGTGDFKEAIITQGGVGVREVNPSTMESRKFKGLYFAGEVLDLDALTGGFNLQIAWSTGHLAGENASAG